MTDNELESCYILDEIHDVNVKILANSTNVLFFRNSLITQSDLEVVLEKLTLAYKSCKNITILSIFLCPAIVDKLLSSFPGLKFFTIYNSNLFDSMIKQKLEAFNDKSEYSYSKEFKGSESLCHLFRKQMLSYLDDY